jgi:hypothetical protein
MMKGNSLYQWDHLMIVPVPNQLVVVVVQFQSVLQLKNFLDLPMMKIDHSL